MTNNPQDTNLPLVQHLIELRNRLLKIILVILAIFLGLFSFAQDIYTLAAAPLLKYLPENSTMIATEVASPFLAPFKLSFFVALAAAIPYLLYQVWSFIAPGLYQHEKRVAIPLLISSIVLFYTGIAFAYFLVLPLLFEFFTSASPSGVMVMTDISRYLDFILTLFFAFGLAFEIPIATFLLIWIRVVSPEGLARKRPYVIVGCFVVGMFLTPPDIFSQTLLAVPMWLLFEAGVFFGRFVSPKSVLDEAPHNQ